jgi:flagellar motor switch protein FliM
MAEYGASKSVQQTTYGAYIASLPQTTTMFLLDLAPLKVTSIVEFSPQAAMLMIHYMLGGQGEDNQPERGLTEIETTLLSSMVDRMLGELKYVMAPVLPLQPRIMATESSPQFAQVSPPSDQVVVVHFDMDINEVMTPATLCLPFKELLPHLDRAVANARTRRDDADSIAIARAVETRVRMAPVEVAVRMGPTNIRMLEIATMEVGDVIKLRHPVNVPLEVIGSDLVYGYAVPGSDGQRAACLIVNPNEEQ